MSIANREPVLRESTSGDTVTVLAHQLRTPLASLRGALEALEGEGELDKSTRQLLLRRAQRSALWLQGLIDNVSSLSVLDRRGVRVTSAAVPIRECVDGVVALMQPLLEAKSQTVSIHGPRGVLVEGQRHHLEHVLMNLLTNASRYGAVGDNIEVSIHTRRDRVVLEVTDHGAGVRPDESSHIFERYVRGSAAEGDAAGLGLGLAVVRELVELHGGNVGFENRAGTGTRFRVSLPAGGGSTEPP